MKGEMKKVWSLLLLVAAVLYYGLFGTSLSLLTVMPAAVLLSLSVALTMGGKKRISAGMDWLPSLVMMVAGVYFLLRSYVSPVRDLATDEFLLVGGAMLAYCALAAQRGRPGAFRKVKWCLCVLLAVNLVWFWMEPMDNPVSMLLGYPDAYERTGLFRYYGSFAQFSVVASLLVLTSATFASHRMVWRVALGLLACAGIVSVLVSDSRAAALSLLVGLVVWSGLSVRVMFSHRRYEKIRLWFVGAISAGVVFVSSGLVWVLNHRATREEGVGLLFDSNVRPKYWSMAVDQWLSSPWVGSGSSSYSYLCLQNWNPDLASHEANPRYVHNEFLQLLSDYGLVGLLLLLLVIGVHGFYAAGLILNKKQQPEHKVWPLAGLAALAAITVHCLLDFPMHLPFNLMIAALACVWCLGVRKEVLRDGVGMKVWLARGMSCVSLGVVLSILLVSVMGLRAGWPLLVGKKAKEYGLTEMPQGIALDDEIAMYEEALERAESWRRSKRLGFLYATRAREVDRLTVSEDQQRAKMHLVDSLKLHPADVNTAVNLANLLVEMGEYDDACLYFSQYAELAEGREHFYQVPLRWGQALTQQAVKEDEARDALLSEARKVLMTSKMREREWAEAYAGVFNYYLYLMMNHERMDGALTLWEQCQRDVPQWWITEGKVIDYGLVARLHDLKGYREMKARHPEQALVYLRKAKAYYAIQRRDAGGHMPVEWEKNFRRVNRLIKVMEQ